MDINTSWVKPPNVIGGLDPLAVQAPCISLYGKMLPGITNVTDRAGYIISSNARKELLKRFLALTPAGSLMERTRHW